MFKEIRENVDFVKLLLKIESELGNCENIKLSKWAE